METKFGILINKEMRKYLIIIISLLVIGAISCKKEEFELEDAPLKSDAVFTYNTSAESDNLINFKATISNGLAVWDFGNGFTAKGNAVTGTFPRKGTYTVSLTIFTQGGSASTSQDIVIVNDDFSLLDDPLFTFLTGGIDSINGKTWVIDSAYGGHFGVGPNPSSALGNTPEYYAAMANEKSGVGLYNDEYVFRISGFGFDMANKGDIYVTTDHKDKYPGSFQNKGDYTAPFPEQLNETWKMTFDAGSDTTIEISGAAFIGMDTDVKTFQILSITEDELSLRYLHGGNPALAWYLRLVRKGYDSGSGGGGGGGSTGASLPIDFESNPPTFEFFGGSTADVIANPDSRGINTSTMVLETVHGNEVWAGVAVELANKLDFATDSFIVVKIWSPTAGATLRIKLEDKANSNTSIEADINIPVAFTWIERKINFGVIAASGTFDKLALFPGWDVANAGTFYLDDVKQGQ